jgi:hypothetical protein
MKREVTRTTLAVLSIGVLIAASFCARSIALI